MVWGCITYHSQGLLTFIDGTMDSEKYINVLDENLWPVFLGRPDRGRPSMEPPS